MIFNSMTTKRFKPEKIQISESTVYEMDNKYYQRNDDVNVSDSNSQFYNPVSFVSHWDRFQNSDTSASSSSSFSSAFSETNLHQQSIYNNLNLIEERNKELLKRKESVLIPKSWLIDERKYLIIGESRCNRYIKYDCKIGEGCYKIVYKGYDRKVCREIAWCEVKEENNDIKENYKWILKKIETLLKMDHPHIVKCYEILKSWWIILDDNKNKKLESKRLVIIQELMNQGTLKGIIKRNFHNDRFTLDIHMLIKWWYQIMDALRYMHNRMPSPFVHGNIQSDNCFLVFQPNDDCINVKIGNFGWDLATNHITERYIMNGLVAPEIYGGKYDSKIDIYAFGMIILETITNTTFSDMYTNEYNVDSRLMGKYLEDLISSIKQFLIKEIIMSCVHQISCYRPTADELSEHPIFQNSPVIVNTSYDNLNSPQSKLKVMDNSHQIDAKVKPIIDLKIVTKTDFLQDQSHNSQFPPITLLFDVYLAQKDDLSDLLMTLKTYLESKIDVSSKRLGNKVDQLLISLRLQIQYIIKAAIGERWRKIHKVFLTENENNPSFKTSNDSNSSNLNKTDNDNKFKTNFDEYELNFSMYQKASKCLNIEIENYCQECRIKGSPYFFNMYTKNPINEHFPLKNLSVKANTYDNKLENKRVHQNNINLNCSIHEFVKENEVSSETKTNENQIENTSKREHKLEKDSSNSFSISQALNSSSEKENLYVENNTGLSKDFLTSPDDSVQQLTKISASNDYDQEIKLINSNENSIADNLINMPFNQNSIPLTNSVHLRHFSEPVLMYNSNPKFPMNSIYQIGPNLNSGPISTQSESPPYPKFYQVSHQQFKYNQDPNQFVDYVNNSSLPSVIGRNNPFCQLQLPQSPVSPQNQYTNYLQSNFLNNQSKLILSPYHTISGHNISGLYSGFYNHQPVLFNTNQNSSSMHNNVQYTNPVDHTLRHQTSDSILTRSLPSIIGSPSVSSENAIAPSIVQTSLASGLQSRMPTINNTVGPSDIGSSQRQVLLPNNCSQKLNPSYMLSPRSNITRVQNTVSPVPTAKQRQNTNWKPETHTSNNTTGSQLTYPPITGCISVPLVFVKTRSESTSSITVSTAINNNKKVVRGRSFSQIQEKSKSKKPKTRLKTKYLLRIIEVTEIPNTSEVTLVFEAMLPMNQMRFSCSLNNEINCFDLSKFLGDPGQIPGELRRNDIVESLVCTVKKMCHCLQEDINSIPLNEDYVFHPCSVNSNLIKCADSIYQMQTTSEVFETAQTNSTLSSNQYNYLNTVVSHNMPSNALIGSCGSSRSLSRHTSNEDLSWTVTNPSMAVADQTWLSTSDIEIVNPVPCDNSKSINATVGDTQKKSVKPPTEPDPNRVLTITSKCTCDPASKDCCMRIPEFLYPSVKQIIDKLQNPHTKGLIILPQSNEILLRNLRILEIPTDHMFFGLPCSDSSFNVVKGQKDKDFIIAKDTRQSESPGQNKKCVYQIPTDGAVLVDSTGEIQYIQNPSLVIPQAKKKAQINELPFELTHDKNQSFDYSKIVSVLQSLSTINNASDLTKDEAFDNPVMLEPVNIQSYANDKAEMSDPLMPRRGSGDSMSVGTALPNLNQSLVQVECVSYHYVPLMKSVSGSKPDIDSMAFEMGNDRDLPRQQVRSRKISNESLDAMSSSRNRMGPGPVYLNEMDHAAVLQPGLPKMIPSNSMGPPSVTNVPRPIVNPISVQRLPNITGGPNASNQFVLAAQNPINPMSPNILVHNMASGGAGGQPSYGNAASGAAVAPAVTQSNCNVPVVLPNPNPMGLSFTQIVPPNQVVLSSGGMLPHQMPPPMAQMHIQQPRLASVPTVIPISSQHISNMPPGLPMQNLINVSQSMMLPGYATSMHSSIPTATSEQHFSAVSHPTEMITVKDQMRQMPTGSMNIRQMSVGNTPFYDTSILNSNMMSDPNIRMRLNQTISSTQSQSQPKFFIPYQNLITTTAQPMQIIHPSVSSTGGINQSKQVLSDQPTEKPIDVCVAVNNQISPSPDTNNKLKAEQTIGRFVIRPVAESPGKT